MQNNYSTQRLVLNTLKLSDAEFIFELVNTPEWINFIGNRNVKTIEDAQNYIQKIIDNPSVCYWVVSLQEQPIPIGVITFIKRDYLDHHDIGFAFLENYVGKGYAHEAANAVLTSAMTSAAHTTIFATTVKENKNSIQLLEKLGLRFLKEINVENELLLVYSVTAKNFSTLSC